MAADIPVPAVPAAVEGEEQATIIAATTSPTAAAAEAMLRQVRATTMAALCRELLKLGAYSAQSKEEKAVDKEFVKILSTLEVETWAAHYDVSKKW